MMKNPKPSSSHHHMNPSSSSSKFNSNRKSRWESSDQPPTPSDPKSPRLPNSTMTPKHDKENPNPNSNLKPSSSPRPSLNPNPLPSLPNPMAYGFHNLERRTVVLADGAIRSYFALPPDYPMEPQLGLGPPPGLGQLGPVRRFSPDGFREAPLPPPGRDYGRAAERDYWSSLGLDGPSSSSSLKRKFPHDDSDELALHRQHVLQYGKTSPPPSMKDSRALRLTKPERGGPKDSPASAEVDAQALKRAFLRFSKAINENPTQKKYYLEDGKIAPLQCIVCGRASKEFTDVHNLLLHVYNAKNADLRVDHLGLHKALCVLMGWSYTKEPHNLKAYQSLSVEEASANKEDLIVWPPVVIIHNTNTGRIREGRMEGLGNKDMDLKLKELGFGGGKSKSMYGKEGHLGFTVVKFADSRAGLKDAERLAEYFEKDNHGRKGWARAEASKGSVDDEKNPALVKVDEKSGEKKRIFYAYLATASDIEKLDADMAKKSSVKSRKELDLSD